jgi:tetratricopeptide (TPR) repeat protein
MLQRIERGGLTGEYPIDYVVGSGNAGFSYLTKIGDRLFQSPISYYARRDIWDMAPGFEKYPAPEFNRSVQTECMWCHADPLRSDDGVVGLPESAIDEHVAISCARCHGPAERHLAEPMSGNIINPAKLPLIERDSVCEQCHLSGEARVLNPGKDFPDFAPGMRLEEVFSTYLYELPAGDADRQALKVISHAEQLRLSACAQASGGRLWCGTCHNPHEDPASSPGFHGAKCLSCHAGTLEAEHASQSKDCVRCHMPRQPVYDGGHSSFTNHRIARRPQADAGRPAPGQLLQAWREPEAALQQRNLGLAHIKAGDAHRSEQHYNEGYRLLAGAYEKFSDDPDVSSALGRMLVLKGAVKPAEAMLEKAVHLQPANATAYLHLAVARRAAEETSGAIEALEAALKTDPYLIPAYQMLAKIHADSGDEESRRRTWQRYLEVFPRSINARAALKSPGRFDYLPGPQ